MPYRGLGLFGLVQHFRRVAIEFASRVGHPQPPRRAVEQPNPEARLELADAVAQCRFRKPKRAAGGGEAAPINHLHEIEEVVEVEHRVPNRPTHWMLSSINAD